MRIKADAVVWSDVGEETVGLDLVRSEYFTANETATVLIRRLRAGDTTWEQMRDELLAQFVVEPDAAASGVDRLVATLRSRDLLED